MAWDEKEMMAENCKYCGNKVYESGGVGTVLDWLCNDCGAFWSSYETFPPRDPEMLKKAIAKNGGPRE